MSVQNTMQDLSALMIAAWNAPREQVTDEIDQVVLASSNTISAASADNYRGAAVNDDNDKDASVKGDDDVEHDEDKHNGDGDIYDCPSVDPTIMSSLRVLKDRLKDVTTMVEQLRKGM